MATFKVKGSKAKGARSIVLTYNFGKDLGEAMKMFDHKVIHSLFVDAATIQLQGKVRPMLRITKGAKGYKSDDVIQKDVAAMKPTMGRKGDSVKKKARLVKAFENMTEAERAEVIAAVAKGAGIATPKLVKAKKAA
jgi:hypothetical protein